MLAETLPSRLRLFTANGIVEHMKTCSAGVDSELLLLWEEEHASKCTGPEALIADFEAIYSFIHDLIECPKGLEVEISVAKPILIWTSKIYFTNPYFVRLFGILSLKMQRGRQRSYRDGDVAACYGESYRDGVVV
ncbi:hypothetical protein Tco_1578250 [Tanacetum coccineum]